MQKLLVVCSTFLLVACGGGGDDASPTPTCVAPKVLQNGVCITPAPIPTPTQNGSLLQASFDKQAGMLTLEWQDIATNELGYRVERKVESAIAAVTAVTSVWNTVEDLPAYDGQGQKITWKKPITTQGEYRVLVKLPTENRVLLTNASKQSLTISPNIQANIILSKVEPLNDKVDISIQAVGFTPTLVSYYVDLSRVSSLTSTVAPSFILPWDTAHLADGNHLLAARLEIAKDNYLFISRAVKIDNPIKLKELQVKRGEGVNRDTVNVLALASADVGIKQVQLFLNNQPLAILTEPLQCIMTFDGCTGIYGYGWDIPVSSLLFGQNELLVRAESMQGAIAERTAQYHKDDNPVISLIRPTIAEIVHKDLIVSGTVVDELDDIAVSIKLRDVEIYSGANKNFSTIYDMSSLPFGTYTITVTAKAKTGNAATATSWVSYRAE